MEAQLDQVITEIHTTEKDLMRLKPHIHLLQKKGVQLVVHSIEVRDITQGGPTLLKLVDHYTDHAMQQAINAFPNVQSKES